jgi:hypothetical protein
MSLAVMSYSMAVKSGGPAPSTKSPRPAKPTGPAPRASRPVVKVPPTPTPAAPQASQEEDAERWDGMS